MSGLDGALRIWGHIPEEYGKIITMDFYGDRQEIIVSCAPELTGFMEDVLPEQEAGDKFRE